jgi:hypothetical protein
METILPYFCFTVLYISEDENYLRAKRLLQTKVQPWTSQFFPFNFCKEYEPLWQPFSAHIVLIVAQVTKFSYLKELVEPKVRIAIEGLPFTTEGYKRAKIILETKYGKISEVTNAHIKHIMSLPTIQGTAKANIHDFYDILVTHVQALETLGKLREINGYVRLTLDKYYQA